MTREQRDEILQSAERLRQIITAVYRNARGAEEYALSVCIGKVGEIEQIVVRCA